MAAIRAFRAGDEPRVVSLWRECGLVVPWNDPHLDLQRKLRDSPDELLVAELESGIVGSVMVGYDGHRGWIYYLAVDPSWRRSGIGRALVARAEEVLAARGCPKVNLMVRGSKAGVIGFYAALGYERSDVVTLGRRLEDDDAS